MSHVEQHLNILGFKVSDLITGVKGIATSVSFDLYGCVQVLVNRGLDSKGEIQEQRWFDISRLKVISKTAVIDQPNFTQGKQAEGKQGAAEKPCCTMV